MAVITGKQVAGALGLSEAGVRKMADAGRLPVLDTLADGTRLFDRAVIDRLAILKAMGLPPDGNVSRSVIVEKFAACLEGCDAAKANDLIAVLPLLLPDASQVERDRLGVAVTKAIRRAPTMTRTFGAGERRR